MASLDTLFEISLTTREGEDNSWDKMVQDNRNLRKAMAREGYHYEDRMCGELTPDKHLLHLHGIHRYDKPWRIEEIHRELSRIWNLYHNSFVVWVTPIYNPAGAIKYNVKHILKNWRNGGLGIGRILESKGWCPPGYKEVSEEFKRFVLTHSSITDYAGKYIASIREVANDLKMRWARGEIVILDFDDYEVMIWGNQVVYPENLDEIIMNREMLE